MKKNFSKPMTYKDAGVDIDAGNLLAQRLGPLARSTYREEVVAGIGGFAGLMALPTGLQDPLLVSGTDGVGTKLKVAFLADRHHTVGIDLVAMAVNDILTLGAEPLFFLDYFATGKLEIETAEAVVKGIAEGCRQAGCSLLGGETAEMPGMYKPGEYDLAGFAVGVVERERIIDGKRVLRGDQVIGLPSSGLHSNGYSLARRVLITDDTDIHQEVPELGCSLSDELLKPTQIYTKEVLSLIRNVELHALVHITGGGLVDNPPRCLPNADLAFELDTKSWKVPKIIELIGERGAVPLTELRRAFNMGLGLLVVVPKAEVERTLELLQDRGGRIVGQITSRSTSGEAVEFI